MNHYTRSAATLAAAILLLTGCPTDSADGRFLPACSAYEGDSLTLANGRYTWDRFTDSVQVDAEGNAVDAFPAYPKSGSFDINGERLAFTPDDSTTPPFVNLVRANDRVFLLTSEEFSSLQSTGDLPACALVLQQSSEN